MSELFMECVEEELEPWQKQVPQVNLIDDDDDDDEPIFVGVISNNRKEVKPKPAPPPKNSPAKPEVKSPPAVAPTPIVLPLSVPVTAVNTTPISLTTVTPQPVIVNNQGFIVASPQLAKNNEFIATLGARYPPGTSFTIVPAGQQQIFQQIAPGTIIPSVVHRPQVQQIRNNIVTLSNVQNPTVYSSQLNQPVSKLPNSVQTTPVVAKDNCNNKDQATLKRALTSPEVDNLAKKLKLDSTPAKVLVRMENGVLKKKCSKCQEDILSDEAQRYHLQQCSGIAGKAPAPTTSVVTNKLIMLVSDFYYGNFEGDLQKREAQKTNNTFKCQSCLKVLKNNIRFMNHMKHHLELEKQNSESWESHTTCHHCYRQYMTPFQLQCHIESAHSPIESSTNCKICELAFESEQVLLEHMKANHKPGEMPYVCQVCSYRSSFFSDLEAHFRSVHENTKDLLCPFCLKVLRTSHIFMQHYMKHQRKGIHRCGKCRLNFLTYKEKADHRTHVHKTFRKPKALEGLPPGTKVTIRASLTGKEGTPAAPVSSAVTLTQECRSSSPFAFESANSVTKFRLNDSAAQKTKMNQNKKRLEQNKKQERRSFKHNLELKHLGAVRGKYICIECNSVVDDFFLHYPLLSNCGACKYRTSCKTSIENHMIKFHSTFRKRRILKKGHKTNTSSLKLTLVCLTCDLLVDASGSDLMTKHLVSQPHHICKVIKEKDGKVEEKELNQQQPLEVQQSLETAPTPDSEEMDQQKGAESVTNDTDIQPELEPELPVDDQKKEPVEVNETESTAEGELNDSPQLSSTVCTSDENVDICQDSADPSQCVTVQEQIPVLKDSSDHLTEVKTA
ncbi:zinc finger protein 280C [Oryzias melastigma]|uniref:Zinc finger protein 280D n=1 Tax=Oryzias melastigma TaxID=30732 RepID=A0A3B3CZ71_ORYME|nr:zinc finger protein 280C [Oryzias melastigma]